MRVASSIIFTFSLAAATALAARNPLCPNPAAAVPLYRGRTAATGNTFYSTDASEFTNAGIPRDSTPLARIFPSTSVPGSFITALNRYVATTAGEDDHVYTTESTPTLTRDGIDYALEGPQGYIYNALGFALCNGDLPRNGKMQLLYELYSETFTDHAYVLQGAQFGGSLTAAVLSGYKNVRVVNGWALPPTISGYASFLSLCVLEAYFSYLYR
ncbi:hypothetical protein HGRIS_003637 [Hohenbuehelia grisea]|uniref:Uncharacterized protein n=1 Tax=Hohenbuehelia grisea TaxID=104357 RepID=A0ABR3JG71_9AGAR